MWSSSPFMSKLRYFQGIALSFFLLLLVSSNCLAAASSFQPNCAPNFGLTAHSAILIDADTGRVIFEKNPDAREYPASMTKMMTCILSLEYTKPDDKITISPEAVGVDGSSLYLQKGDVMTMQELRQGMMLVSGNDAAVAIACAVKQSVPAFVELMNAQAQKIGALNTHFANPNGLPNDNHYSTARDMALIAQYGWRMPAFRAIVDKKEADIHWLEPKDKHFVCYNTNHLLWRYPYANGIKTGYTEEAGGCLAASATKDGTTLIAVVMHASNAEDRFTEAQELLAYGFTQVHDQLAHKKEQLTRTLHVHGGEVASIKVMPENDIYYPIKKDENSQAFSCKMVLPNYLTAPVKKGDVVGKVEILYQKKIIGSVPIIAQETSKKGFNALSILYSIYDNTLGFF